MSNPRIGILVLLFFFSSVMDPMPTAPTTRLEKEGTSAHQARDE
jgi:hypothetical protein